jgi:hypothetical protein
MAFCPNRHPPLALSFARESFPKTGSRPRIKSGGSGGNGSFEGRQAREDEPIKLSLLRGVIAAGHTVGTDQLNS